MKIITAPEEYEITKDDICVFLAGGITNCWEWQNRVIEILKAKKNTDNLVVFNPRRENFPIHDPTATNKQITWEFDNLEKMDIFSMYFSSGESDQPICMYELGRNLCRMKERFPDYEDRIVISVEYEYKREKDIEVQTSLATRGKIIALVTKEPKLCADFHAYQIYKAYELINKRKKRSNEQVLEALKDNSTSS